jgi:hypothetical protein
MDSPNSTTNRNSGSQLALPQQDVDEQATAVMPLPGMTA